MTVHGYNATPVSWGAVTAKDDERDKVFVATKLQSYTGPATNKSKLSFNLAEDIHAAGVPYHDFKPSKTDAYWGNLNSERFFPFEEGIVNPAGEGSYTGINHTYVETYCSNYAYESDDATDAKASSSRYEDGNCSRNPNECYKLKAFRDRVAKLYGSPYGGQTQLIRTRIVQLLNEYYGDWKWLHDPTAKINIVAHSNGGLIVTNALANDEHYFNAGISKDYPAETYYINGLGVRLSDHINQVQTVDTPFEGSPLSDNSQGSILTDIGPGIFRKYSGSQGVAVALLNTSFFPLYDKLLRSKNILCVLLAPSIYLSSQILLNEIGAGLVVKTGTPLNKSMEYNSNFLKATKGTGKAPELSNQTEYQTYSLDAAKKIPYVNYVGVMQDWGVKTSVLTTLTATAFTILMVQCFVAPATCNPNALVTLGSVTLLLGGSANWFYTSDGIVSKKSQKMTTIYNDVDPDRYNLKVVYKGGTYHGDMPKQMTDAIITRINNKPDLKITHVIGANQIATVDEDDITEKIPREQVSEDAVLPNNCVTLHPIARFNGMNNPDLSLAWPAKDETSEIITTTTTTGKAVKIVGYIKNAYMNRVSMYVLVNGKRTDMIFNTHFGKWASKNIDRNGDEVITNDDWPGGSWFFTPDISCDIVEGDNTVQVVATEPSATHPANESLVATVKVVHGKALGVFEANAEGMQIKSEFFNLPIRWDIAGEETKTIGFGFTDEIARSTNTLDPDGIHINAGEATRCNPPNEISLREVDECGSLDPREFCLADNPAMPGHLLGRFKLGTNILKKVDGTVTIDQLLHFRFIDAATSTWSNANIPFYVDNEPVQQQLFLPPQPGDCNGDGIVDASDNCVVSTTVPPDACANVCIDANLDPSSDECAGAIAQCNTLTGQLSSITMPEFDGVDNDLDGAVDIANDISEMSNIEYYSPQFDLSDKLTTEPVMISFTVTDNLQHIFRTPKKVQIKVYKVLGNVHSPAADQLLFVGSGLEDQNGLKKTYGDFTYQWPFLANQIPAFTNNNPPADGLYCVVVTSLDLAGVEGTSDEVSIGPGYFIVDRTPPSFSILKDWHDAQTDQPVLNRNTERFLMYYRPGSADLSGPFSDRFGSETVEFDVVFHATYAKNDLYANIKEGYYNIGSVPAYRDILNNAKYIYSQAGLEIPDGVIDPTVCEVMASQDWNYAWWEKKWFKPDLPDGKYTVEYIARDKAGNETTVHDLTSFITVEREMNDIPTFTDDKMQVDRATTEWNPDDETKGTKTTENTANDEDLTTDIGNISYIPLNGAAPVTGAAAELTIRVSTMNNTGNEAQIGLTIRNSTNNNDVMAEIVVNDDGNVIFVTRTVADQNRTVIAQVPVGMVNGLYLRISRNTSGVVTGWYSTNGIAYTPVGTVTIGTQDIIIGIIHRQLGPIGNQPGTATFTVTNNYTDTWIPVQPILENVVNNCNGTHTAYFGYNNPNNVDVVLQHGSYNYFKLNGVGLDVLKRTSRFAPGRHASMFTVDFNGTSLVWNLNGLTVTAQGVTGTCDPVYIPGSVTGYAVYGFNQVDLGDYTELTSNSGKCATASGSGSGVTIGVSAKVKSIESRGQITLRNYASCYDFATSDTTITLQQGATCPTQTPNYTFADNVLPSTMWTGTINLVGVPQTTTIIETSQTKTLTPGKYWNYTARVNGKLKLSAGTYYFHDLNMEGNSIIECNVSAGPVKIFIQNYYYSGATCTFIGGDASKVLYGYLGTITANVDKLKGTLIAPKATINAGGWSKTFYGQLIGKTVIMHPNCNFNFVLFNN